MTLDRTALGAWFQDLPEGWSAKRLKHLGRLKGGSGFPVHLQGDTESELAFYKVGDLAKSKDGVYLDDPAHTITRPQAKSLGARVFEEGTLVWAKIGAALLLNRRRIVSRPCCIDNNMTGFVPENAVANTKFCYYLTSAIDFSPHVKPGAVPSFSEGDQAELSIPLPPLDLQRAIAATLDRETARIDALIEKKTRFIELLKEKRQALLHDCLMHPDTIRMRVERCTESPTRPMDRDDEVSYTRLGLYNRGRGIFHKPEAIGRELGDSSFTWVHEGDLIVSGQFAWEGAVSLASNDEHGCVISHRYHTYRGKHDVTDTAYLWAYFTSHEGDFVLNDHSRGSAGRNRPLNPNTLAKEKIPVPPMVMQKRVAALVEFENRFKALVARSTALLNERRSALITGAVTGQLDQRENAA